MRKFKLIKEYPTSPELNTIFNYWTDNISEQVHNIIYGFIPLKTIKQYPEFWQEIIEKDYEILSFKSKLNCIINKIDDNYFGLLNGGVSGKYLLNNRLYTIHSVKRLSDGEIFTIGDKIEGYKNTGIKEFKLESFGLRVITDANGDGCVTDKLSWKLKDCVKSKQSLFTTEDDVEIFENSEYWIVTKFWNLGKHFTGIGKDYTKTKQNSNKRFSTKQSAENYIKCHKPCLSLTEVLNNIDSLNILNRDNIKNIITKLVKSKLNL